MTSIVRGEWLRGASSRLYSRRARSAGTFGLVLLGPLLVFATFIALGPLDQIGSASTIRVVLLADLVYILVLATLVLRRIVGMVAARRARSAGSRLHLRLTAIFALIALVPTILVAVFAVLTINIGLEGWFSERVRGAVAASLAAAEAYEEDERQDLLADAGTLAAYLEANRVAVGLLSDGDLRRLLVQGQGQIQRGLREAYVVDGTGEIRARGERSYLFDFERPTADEIQRAREDGWAIVQDWDVNEFRVIYDMPNFVDRLLYITRDVDGELLSLLDDTQQTVLLYHQLEDERGRILFEFGLLYLAFALILILAAIWLGLWLAERLSRPVGQLASAAQRVGAGDLDVSVTEAGGDDEIAMLGRVFNQMTRQLKGQRETLLATNRQIRAAQAAVRLGPGIGHGGGRRPRLRRAGGVRQSVGRAAAETRGTGWSFGRARRRHPRVCCPLRSTARGRRRSAQEEVPITRNGAVENLLVQMATRRSDAGNLEGYVVAFDDVTDLVTAQRMAAWGDVARRIAHEIKNPLTPIQLSAERIRRKFRGAVGDEGEKLDQMTEVIIRQTADLRRIVDEFSKFARMPQPERRRQDLRAVVRDTVTLQEAAQEDAELTLALPDHPVDMDLDQTLMGQALTNLIKNAGEAIESRRETGAEFAARIEVSLESDGRSAVLTITDNGIGLPPDRARLFEPYVTTRAKGTGLGLPIVRKIIEEHGGTLRLTDAPDRGDGHRGATAEIVLPVAAGAKTEPEKLAAAGGAR